MKGLINNEWLIPAGVICLLITVLSDCFLSIDAPILDSVIGVVTGVSAVLDLVELHRKRKGVKLLKWH